MADLEQGPLGPARHWPTALQNALATADASRAPIAIFWGAEHCLLYNEACALWFGSDHPVAFGRPAAHSCSAAWEKFVDAVPRVLATGQAVWCRDQRVPCARDAASDDLSQMSAERHWTWLHAPLRGDDGEVQGVIGTAIDTTEEVQARRFGVLREIAERLVPVCTREQLAAIAIQGLGHGRADFPFALLYFAEGDALMLAGSTGVLPGGVAAPRQLVHGHPLWPRLDASERDCHVVVDLRERGARVPDAVLPAEADTAVLLPLRTGRSSRLLGQLVLGMRSAPDEPLRECLQRIALRAAELLERGHDAVSAGLGPASAELVRLVHRAPMPLSIVRGSDLVFELTNDACRRLLRVDDPVGRTLASVCPDLIGAPFAEQLQHARARGEVTQGELVQSCAERAEDTGRCWTFFHVPLPERDGSLERVATFAYETTDQRLAQREIGALRAEVAAALHAKDEFLALLGHELRNPLSPIVTGLQLLRMRGAAYREQAMIERQVEHLLRLVDDLLDVSRITRGTLELRAERVDVGEAVARAAELAGPLIDQRHQVLDVDLPAGLAVSADRGRVAQVLAQLLSNAAKYSEPGQRIAIRAEAADGAVTLRVKDQGHGIRAEDLERIFDLFTQLPVVRDSRCGGGLGLGLTIVRRLVEMQGGHVLARSEGPGLGSEFAVTLAAAEPELAPACLPRLPEELGATSAELASVLVVDDNQDAAIALAEALRQCGHRVVVAHDAPEALRVAESFTPRVAILDIGLPIMDGYELAERLRARFGRAIALVALTGYGQASARERSRAAGFAEHLVKPVELPRLRRVLEQLAHPVAASATPH